ncbi:uncharacterized protein RHOBADRAFT_51056 [Rhodotorula graminis WP1]|uniref:RlpA-like protein double-psi beta-barrel domain-containing protein n=1 Tax=Rhodotorula graminis (strain WP1) TaxID=578459 RepID=A0A194SDB6_RHOGW|nr:uncharacterized protein RHOBADRAFT_51056 [Rhodotorula graminis WP1]KPV78609.1 hypothetical protein RHOBADRAFT_51056 [Rhodotorula graminis WP1]
MKSLVALSAAALFASSVAAHGPTGERQSLHRRGVERLHRRAKPVAVETRSTESSDATETTAIWWAEDGWVGACGSTIDNTKLQVGLPLSLYANADAKSSLCGTKAYATNPATGASVTVTVVDGSDRTAFSTFSKSAFLALGGDADVGMLPIQITLSKEANAGVVAAAGVVANGDSSSSKASSSKEKASSSAKQVESKDVEVPVATTAAPAKTTAAPAASTTPAPTTSYDSQSAAAASKAAASAAAADAASSSKAAAKAYESDQAAILAASQASAAQSSQAAAAAASSKAAADAAASQEAAASSKAAEDAAAAAAASSSKAAAAASASAAAAAADNKDNSSSGGSSGGHVYSGGYATFYTQNGIAGNCGAVNPDSAYIVALPTATYAGGSHCGQKVRLTRVETGKTITATVADSCPTCVNNSCLDLSVSAFTAIATEEEGMVSITWEFI